MNIYEKIGNNLKAIRTENKLSQEEMANILGMSQRVYSYYEKGMHKIPIDQLVKVADIFKMSLDDLVK